MGDQKAVVYNDSDSQADRAVFEKRDGVGLFFSD